MVGEPKKKQTASHLSSKRSYHIEKQQHCLQRYPVTGLRLLLSAGHLTGRFLFATLPVKITTFRKRLCSGPPGRALLAKGR
jgi:hypothetical protein